MVEKLSCEQCSFQTKYKRNLNSHIQTVHSKIEKFECQDCDFSSAYQRNLDRHCREVHGI